MIWRSSVYSGTAESGGSETLNNLRDRVILIGGATGVLGMAVVREFARSEARLALTGRSSEKLASAVADIGLTEDRSLAVAADVSHADDVTRLVSAVIDRYGRVDVLLNTVGGWRGGKTVAEITVDQWDQVLALNLRPAFLLSREVLPRMLEAGWGRLVHVSSRAAPRPRAKQAGYSVSKMGVITLTEVIAAEVKGTGVTANVILPSIIDTPSNRATMTKPDPSKWVPPDHIAQVMRFLCSDAAASINGARIPVFGAV